MKRTKRYGGFLVGDRVQRNDGVFNKLPNGIVTGMRHGFIYTKWTDLNGKDFGAVFMPNQLINLTRQDEERILNGTWNFVRPYPYNKDFSSTADY